MTTLLLLIPAAAQASAMLVDEGWFHYRRPLPRWERVGHPLDTLTTTACYLWLVVSPKGTLQALYVFMALAAFSCLFVTKDEFVHSRCCTAGETWLHAVLFVLHPIVFFSFGVLWWSGAHPALLHAQLALSLAFAAYQTLYWNLPWKRIFPATGRSTTQSTPSSAIAGTRPRTIR